MPDRPTPPTPSADVRIGFAITQHCNLRCPHCIRDDVTTVRSLPLQLFRSVVDQAVELFGDPGVSLTGGEPLLHPDFDGMVDHLRRLDLRWRIVTNGWHTRRALPSLTRHPPEFVRLSLSGVDEATHDEIRGRDSFRRVLSSAALLTARRIPFGLSLIVDRRTRPRLAEVARLAADLGAWQLHFVLPQPVAASLADGTELPLSEWAAVRDEVLHLDQAGTGTRMELAYGAPFDGPESLCAAKSLRQLYVDARGRLCTCCQLSDYGGNDREVLAHLGETSLAKAWEMHRTEIADLTRRSTRRNNPDDPLDAFPCLRCARSCGKLDAVARSPGASALPVVLRAG